MEWNELQECDNTCIICGLICKFTNLYIKYYKDCIIKWLYKKGECLYCRANAYYHPKSNNDNILLYDFETLYNHIKKIKYKI